MGSLHSSALVQISEHNVSGYFQALKRVRKASSPLRLLICALTRLIAAIVADKAKQQQAYEYMVLSAFLETVSLITLG